MTAKLSTTPTATVARALRALGLVQGLDFRVTGVYVNGERTGTLAVVFGPEACAKVAGNADQVVADCANYGHTFRVKVYRANDVTVQN